MLNCSAFFHLLKKNGFDFFTGVPDSLLKDICAYITDHASHSRHIIAANEGNALAIASGYYLATGKPAVVYMQNSGLGNTVNPLTSLTSSDVYSIPLLFIVGWRGQPGVKDEPQHKQMGRIQHNLLQAVEVPHADLGNSIESAEQTLQKAITHMNNNSSPFAIIVPKDTFAEYKLKSKKSSSFELSREDAIKIMLPLIGKKDIIVSTTGKTSRELFELRENRGDGHKRDFLCVGNMGHTSSLALGVAIAKSDRTVWCFDGDGSLIMHMGAMAIIGQQQPINVIHIVFNNLVHDSVGGQPTAAESVDFSSVAKACSYKHTFSVSHASEIKKIISDAKKLTGPIFIEIKCNKGSRSDLGRPTRTPKENKTDFMEFVLK